MMNKFRQYSTTNLSFEEVFKGEYDLDLKQAPETVLDIGANEGAFTAWALERWPGCLIHAFEPMSFNADLFRDNHHENANVTFWENAVSNLSKLTVFMGAHNSGECSAHDIGEQNDSHFEVVKGVRPETIPSCEFIKIDTEGCELEILKGLDLSKAQGVVLEYHRDSDCEPIVNVLNAAGLKICYCQPRCTDRGVMKFARVGALKEKIAPNIKNPDMNLAGTTKDGVLVAGTLDSFQNPTYNPKLKGKKLFIGIPVYSQVPTTFLRCLMELQANKPLPIEVHIGQGDGIGRTRNVLTAAFLKSTCTHLLFHDSDLLSSAQHIADILLADKEVIGGFYPKKQQGPLEWVVNALPDAPQAEGEFQRVKYAGTGFLCF